MLTDKILIRELLSVDRLAARALHYKQATVSKPGTIKVYPVALDDYLNVDRRNEQPTRSRAVCTYITPREIATLEHEPRNDPMEFTTLIAKPPLSRTKSAKVLSRLWHDITVELKDDSSRRACAIQGIRAGLICLGENESLGSDFTIIHSEVKVDL